MKRTIFIAFLILTINSLKAHKEDERLFTEKSKVEDPQRPNMVWFFTDQLRTDGLGTYGNSWISTPNLDAIAGEGTVFTNHFIQSPACVPSRTAILTSLYPHQTGIYNNLDLSRECWIEEPQTFPQVFAQNGYITCNIGKTHGPLQHDKVWQINNINWEGYFFKPSSIGKFSRLDYEILDAKPITESIFSGITPLIDGHTEQSYLIDLANQQLNEFKEKNQPFLLRISMRAPHGPVLVSEEFYNMYDPNNMGYDKPTWELLNSLPAYEQEIVDMNQVISPEKIRRYRASYYGLVSYIDELVGQVMQTLKANGQYENTIFIFSSDHGNSIGEYGRFTKQLFYDIITRVPLIISGPGAPAGVRIKNLTESIDLGTTLLNMAGIPVPEAMQQGKNMFDAKQYRDEVIGEFARRNVKRVWIRTERWSMNYTYAINDRKTSTPRECDGKLVDLLNDPLEHVNLYYDPEYTEVVRELTQLLEKRRLSAWKNRNC